MFNKIKKSVRELKDNALSLAITKTCNYYIKEFGEMLKFDLDSQNKKIYLDLMLKGEQESLKVEIKDYEIIVDNDKAYITFKSVVTSREWINTVVETFLKDNKKVEIPKQYVKLLGVVI